MSTLQIVAQALPHIPAPPVPPIMTFDFEGGKVAMLQVFAGLFTLAMAWLMLKALGKGSFAGMLGAGALAIVALIFTVFPNAAIDLAKWLGGMFFS